MSNEIKGLKIPSTIVPFSKDDVYATHDSKFGKGGWHSVESVEDMFKIPVERRTIGMIVYVCSTKETYVLNTTLSNEGWKFYSDHIDKHFSYTEKKYEESKKWVIHHGLNKIPSVQVFDSEGREICGGITIIDNNNITIEFNTPTRGTAELN